MGRVTVDIRSYQMGKQMSAKEQYQLAQHAIRNLKTNGNTVMGHDYFLQRVARVRADILQKAWATI